MNKAQFSAALKIATSDKDLSSVDNSHIIGYGLPDFKPVVITLDMVAKEIRHNSFTFAGTIDPKGLAEVFTYGKRAFMVV